MQSTPHSGFHWDGRKAPYFEGWYYRITIPSIMLKGGISFAFMYSIQNPLTDQQTCAVQIIGPSDEYIWSSPPPASGGADFLACPSTMRHSLRVVPPAASPNPPRTVLPPTYSVTPSEHSGEIFDSSRSVRARWHFRVAAVYGWGQPDRRQQSTAGWMSRFQLFEPGWQVLMAHGRASGWIEWKHERWEHHGHENRPDDPDPAEESLHSFQQVPFYAEKNWGVSFPRRWFWVQCNAFLDQPCLTLTSAGGIRRLLGWEETLGMIGLHHEDAFYEFVPWNSLVSWRVAPWGSWQIWARSASHVVELIGRTSSAGVRVRVPTAAGLDPLCRDTTHGDLALTLWAIEGGRKRPILRARSSQAGLEIGGNDWDGIWSHPGSR